MNEQAFHQSTYFLPIVCCSSKAIRRPSPNIKNQPTNCADKSVSLRLNGE
ncbi:MAG: hypothetical protein LH614_12070 [Pyrinomonadaceae bacterium]|nr:hypothetical protein [Pyrinomonadaceae bacterium]